MPEGNEIHRWAERHSAAFAGKTVRVDGPQGRFTDSSMIDGRKLKRVLAVGKHLGYDFGKDLILHVHLGLQGDFTEGSGPLPEVRGALRLRMWNEAAVKRPAVPAVAWGQASTGLPAPSTNGIGGVPVPTLATGYLYYNSGTNSFVFQSPSGSGSARPSASSAIPAWSTPPARATAAAARTASAARWTSRFRPRRAR